MAEGRRFRLTNKRNAPNAKTKANGPARSVSCRMAASVSRKGFNTASV